MNKSTTTYYHESFNDENGIQVASFSAQYNGTVSNIAVSFNTIDKYLTNKDGFDEALNNFITSIKKDIDPVINDSDFHSSSVSESESISMSETTSVSSSESIVTNESKSSVSESIVTNL
ncbi:hypothetical protein GCM10025879_20290 [Leuconostoc litchii]|uniref:Uncharacterized protein n=1 Tax=Leuconostoc litchii TaxID=1981069 RepID=A0A6P2CRJ3_9LACO|nr:hypothetical protein [Leuconostoc litchii]TYC46879.1 hypothetical protein ESZ47_01685 [Leuconostoc litchii]GMA68783.1 hypothetical protein GCM10025879_00290 [Leuconostoc litchii]GMA70783.1 hypothetical protein GCM10025879_20290 [Leuconostoc litchii]